MSDYDVGKAFERIEDDLISSMIRNLKHHKAEELEEGFEWEQWQAVQLKALDDYKKRNREKFPDEFDSINTKVKELIQDKYSDGQTSQEKKILQAIGKGYKGQETNKPEPGSLDISGKFFKVNDRKLNSLIDSTVNDLTKAEHAVLRRADDQYRKIIFSAHMYAESGGTYEKAVDMATKDFLSAGIDCIEYKNGARHTISDYADMAVKTAGKRAYLRGEGQKRNEWGIHTVIVNKRGNPCPLCLPWVGKVLIDDVYSGGTTKDNNYPLVSEAMSKGFLHPRCRDAYTTYFEGISTPPKEEEPTKEEAELTEQQNALSEKAQHAEREQKRCERISKYSLDSENQRVYHHRAEQWGEKAEEYRQAMDGQTAPPIGMSGKSGNTASLSGKGDIEITENAKVSDTVKTTKKQAPKISTEAEKKSAEALEKSGESGIIKKRQNNFDNVEQARDYIRSDKQNKKIFEGQQRKHIEGTKEYNDYVAKLSKQGKYGPSKLTISLDEAQKLIDMFHGTGTIKLNSRGQIIKEIVTISRIIGLVVNDLTGAELETSTFIIKYSKKGTHMIPTYPQKE